MDITQKLGLNRYLKPSLTPYDKALVVRSCGAPAELPENAIKYVMNSPMHVIKSVVTEQPTTYATLSCTAALYGRTDVLDTIDKAHIWDYIWKYAVEGRCTKTLDYLLNRGIASPECIYESAATLGYIDILEYAYSRGIKLTQMALLCAAEGGCIDAIKWLLNHGLKLHRKVSEYAASKGKLETVIWLHENGCPWDSQTINQAISKRQPNTRIVKYALENGCKFDNNTISYAVRADSVELIDIFVQHGCNLLVDHLHTAIGYGRVKIIEYLLALGCPVDDRAILHSQNIEMLKYLHERGFKLSSDMYGIYDLATSDQWHNIAQYLYDNGVYPDDRHLLACECSNLDYIKWLLSHGCENTFHLCKDAIDSGSIDVLQWLYDNGHVAESVDLIEIAKEMGQQKVKNWLLSIGYQR